MVCPVPVGAGLICAPSIWTYQGQRSVRKNGFGSCGRCRTFGISGRPRVSPTCARMATRGRSLEIQKHFLRLESERKKTDTGLSITDLSLPRAPDHSLPPEEGQRKHITIKGLNRGDRI